MNRLVSISRATVDSKTKSRLFIAVMVFVLICLLFLGVGSVLLGQMSGGTVTGTVFYNDGKTPLTSINGETVTVELTMGGSVVASMPVNSTGGYSFTTFASSGYSIVVLVNTQNVGSATGITVTSGQTTVVNVTTSRALTN